MRDTDLLNATLEAKYRPLYANNWYSQPPLVQLREELRNVYRMLEELRARLDAQQEQIDSL